MNYEEMSYKELIDLLNSNTDLLEDTNKNAEIFRNENDMECYSDIQKEIYELNEEISSIRRELYNRDKELKEKNKNE